MAVLQEYRLYLILLTIGLFTMLWLFFYLQMQQDSVNYNNDLVERYEKTKALGENKTILDVLSNNGITLADSEDNTLYGKTLSGTVNEIIFVDDFATETLQEIEVPLPEEGNFSMLIVTKNSFSGGTVTSDMKELTTLDSTDPVQQGLTLDTDGGIVYVYESPEVAKEIINTFLPAATLLAVDTGTSTEEAAVLVGITSTKTSESLLSARTTSTPTAPVATTPESCFTVIDVTGWVEITNFRGDFHGAGLTADYDSSGICDVAHIVIPETLGGKPVLSIGMPSGNATTGYTSFSRKGALTVTLPASLETIKTNAFYLWNYQRIIWPSNSQLKTIGAYAFRDISNAAFWNIILPPNLISIWNGGFRNLGITGTLSVPNSVTTIGSAAFADNQITAVTSWPLSGVQPSTFQNNNLSSFDFSNVTFFWYNATLAGAPANNGAFQNAFNDSVTTLTLSDGVLKIDWDTFKDNNFETVSLPGTLTDKILGSAFANNPIRNLTLGEGITFLNNNLFAGSYFDTINLPSTLTSIGNGAFFANTAHTDNYTINIPASKQHLITNSNATAGQYTIAAY